MTTIDVTAREEPLTLPAILDFQRSLWKFSKDGDTLCLWMTEEQQGQVYRELQQMQAVGELNKGDWKAEANTRWNGVRFDRKPEEVAA